MPAKGLTLAQVLADKKLSDELISQANNRLQASSNYYKTRLDTMIACYKVYRAIKDATDEADEPNTGPNYAYGIIEDATAALSESILNSRVPTPAKGKQAQDEKPAENFNAIAAAYFATGQYQSDYPNSVRERVICGPSWEVDAWAWRYRRGRRWGREPQPTESGGTFNAMVEVAQDDPVQVGYYTRFPSVFNMRPQPRYTSVEKMKWLIEIEERVPIADLAEHQYVDPATKQKVPFFDLREIMAEKSGGAIIRPSEIDQKGSDHQEQLRQIMDGVSDEAADDTQDDTDQVTLVWVWEPDMVYCLANGKWIVAYIENLFHRSGIPYRLKNCTPQTHTLYGIGMIEPVLDLLYELEDIHILSMRNWVRIINRMVAYNPDAVPYAENDFKPRAMGRIRVRPQLGGSVAGEIMPIDVADVTSSMLAQESNDKGLIERALGMPDFSQGVAGTKQGHETLGGLEKITAQAAKRVAAIRRQELAGFQKQMWRMEGMYSQFMVEKMPFEVYGPDGSTVMAEFDLWDIDTQGRGFNFVIEYDPAFGDDALARNQMMVLQDQAIKYNQAVLTMFPPGSKPLVQIDEIMRRELRVFGFNDTSKVLQRPDGVLTPDAEIRLMMQGQPVQVNPSEDLVAHYIEHLRQASDPSIQEAVAKGALPPDFPLRLRTHIQATAMAIQTALQNPGAILRAKQFAQQPGNAGPAQPGTPVRDNRRAGIADVSPRVPS